MCTTCGCSDESKPTINSMPFGRGREADVPPIDPGVGGHRHGATLRLERDLLSKNDRLAARNRDWLDERGVVALNLLGSPGAGKTALLERTIGDLGAEFPLLVIEGDQATDNDAQRIEAAGADVVQINTGAGCHLDADMIARALEEIDPPRGSLVLIENVGNLVCPALFDLGERAKVVVSPVTEGDDKPIKYPHMFRACSAAILGKVDLLPYVPFDAGRWREHARRVNPRLHCFEVSATRGDGLEGWYGWLRQQMGQRESDGLRPLIGIGRETPT